tara:strand:+ start:510 stop:1010 length:501 start_codon:yes stop_codon:yes gene_type:complete
MKKNVIELMDKQDIDLQIDKYLSVNMDRKQQLGEVFTPTKLIELVLDRLPNSVWKNKNYKWLEPACGTGNFMMIVYKKLMNGLKTEIKDTKARSRHIIEKMLYMVEINRSNVNIVKSIFGNNVNIYCNSFLDIDIQSETNISNFDIILGNPPFQEQKMGKKYGNWI